MKKNQVSQELVLNVGKINYVPASREERTFIQHYPTVIEGTQNVALDADYRLKVRKRDEEGVIFSEITNRQTTERKYIYFIQ